MSMPAWLDDDAEVVAPRLLGCLIIRKLHGRTLTGRIVETEAYSQNDAASHSYKGSTAKTEVMFKSSGCAYVYFTYGMHYCLNIVCGREGDGSAVLIRAIEPVDGEDVMISHRAGKSGKELSNGPAKVCQAMAINKDYNGHDLHNEPLQLIVMPAVAKSDIVQTNRIGISVAKEKLWRFYIRDNLYVSKR